MKWHMPPGGRNDQARPTCFGYGQFQIPDRSGSDRLCSTCMSLGHLESTLWDSINNFHEVIVKHHHSVNALVESACGGCHFCGLLLMEWESRFYLCQEPGGGWVGESGTDAASLDGDIKLKIERVKKTDRFRGFEAEEIQIAILCGDLPPGILRQLICTPMESERSLFSLHPQLLTVNQ